jgi:hypothetical protein
VWRYFNFPCFYFLAFERFPVFAYIFGAWLRRRANGVPAYFAPILAEPVGTSHDGSGAVVVADPCGLWIWIFQNDLRQIGQLRCFQ